MTEYAHYVSETEVTYPRAEEFRGIPNWLSNDSALRKRGYVPLTEVPEPKEGMRIVLDGFERVERTRTRVEPRPYVIVDWHEDPDTHEQRKTGEHTEWMNTEITLDDSYIRVTASHYEEIPAPEPPDTSERDNAERAIVGRIADLAMKYDAMEDIAELELSIPSLLQLAERKGVTDADMQAVKADVAILVLDLMAKEGGTWQSCWDGLRSRFVQWMSVLP